MFKLNSDPLAYQDFRYLFPHMRFFADGDEETGGGKGDGGEDDKGGKGGDDKGKGGKDDKGGEKEDETYSLKIDGESKEYTLDELKDAAQKVIGIESKAEKTAKDRKEAEPGLKILRLAQELRESKSPDETTQKEFLSALGVDSKIIEQVISQATGTGKKDDSGSKIKKDDAKPVTMDQLGPREKAIMEAAERDDMRRIREEIDKSCEDGVDNDKILGKMLDEVVEDTRKKSMRNFICRLVKKDVKSRILAREQYGPEMISSALQTARAEIKELGIPAKVAGQPPLEDLGYAGILGPEIHATEPIKRVSVADPTYHETAAKRLQQMVYKATRKGRKQD